MLLFIDGNNIVYQNQYGFVAKSSTVSDGHDHDFSRSPIVDQFRRSFSNDRRSSIFLLDHFLTIVDRVIILIVDCDLDRGSRSYYCISA